MNDQKWLEAFAAHWGACSGSVHRESNGDLVLSAQLNLPPPVIERVRFVPRGKGMAGLAMLRGEPMQTCNIQTDSSGRIKPMARLVDAQAAIALPVFDSDGAVRAVVGLAFADAGDIPPPRERALLAGAAELP